MPHTESVVDRALVTQTLEEAVTDISQARADLVSVMEVVRSLPSELKTSICSVMESAVDRVTAAEARLAAAKVALQVEPTPPNDGADSVETLTKSGAEPSAKADVASATDASVPAAATSVSPESAETKATSETEPESPPSSAPAKKVVPGNKPRAASVVAPSDGDNNGLWMFAGLLALATLAHIVAS